MTDVAWVAIVRRIGDVSLVEARLAEHVRRIATYEDVLRAPAHMVAEILGGELHPQPRPRLRHGRVALRLGGRLDALLQSQGWVFVVQPELHLGDDVLVPDLAGWRVERYPEGDPAWTDTVPDWLCEVLSPSTERRDRETEERQLRTGVRSGRVKPSLATARPPPGRAPGQKLGETTLSRQVGRQVKSRAYLDAGVPWMWLVNADTGVIEAYEAAGVFWMQVAVVSAADGDKPIPPFDGVPLPLREILSP